MAALVALLATTEDETLQRDMLRGLEQAMVGRAQVTMPAGVGICRNQIKPKPATGDSTQSTLSFPCFWKCFGHGEFAH